MWLNAPGAVSMSPRVSSALIRVVVSGESVWVRHCVSCSRVAVMVVGSQRERCERKEGEGGGEDQGRLTSQCTRLDAFMQVTRILSQRDASVADSPFPGCYMRSL